MIEENKAQVEILSFMSKRGVSIADAMIYVRKLYGISLGEAQGIVASSTHWKDLHRDNQVLHDALENFSKKYCIGQV